VASLRALAFLIAILVAGTVAAQAPVTIRFATWDSGEALAYQRGIATAFEAANPGIQVQVEAYSDGYGEKMAAGFGAGDPPDVAYMWNYPAFAQNLLPMDDLVAADPDAQALLDGMYQNVIDYNRYQGVLLGLPVGFTTHVVYYNKSLFDAAGLSYPAAGWTWSDFQATAAALTDPTKNQFGCAIEAEPDPYDWQAYFWSNGGTFVSADGSTIAGVLNAPENVEVLDMLGDLVSSGACALGGGNNQFSASDLFATGRIGMQRDGIWPLAMYQDSGVDFGTAPLPSFGSKPARNVINVSGISIAKDSRHVDAAWAFVKYFVSPDAQRMRLADLPVHAEVARDFDGRDLLVDPLYGTYYAMIDLATETPAFLLTPAWNRLSSNLEYAISSVLLGASSAQAALDEAVSSSQRLFR
jgi:multiple sugar transport system substrate-binding protein